LKNRLIQNLARDNRALRREVLKLNFTKHSTNTTMQQAKNSITLYKNDVNLKMKPCVNHMFSIILFVFVYLSSLDKMRILCFDMIDRVLTGIKMGITEIFSAIKFEFRLIMQNLIKSIKMYMRPRCKKDSIEEYQELIKRKIMKNIRFKFRDDSLMNNRK
jgi:hypothetical protein